MLYLDWSDRVQQVSELGVGGRRGEALDGHGAGLALHPLLGRGGSPTTRTPPGTPTPGHHHLERERERLIHASSTVVPSTLQATIASGSSCASAELGLEAPVRASRGC